MLSRYLDVLELMFLITFDENKNVYFIYLKGKRIRYVKFNLNTNLSYWKC